MKGVLSARCVPQLDSPKGQHGHEPDPRGQWRGHRQMRGTHPGRDADRQHGPQSCSWDVALISLLGSLPFLGATPRPR